MTDLKKEKTIYTRKIGTSFLNKANDEAIKINEKIKSEEELPEYYITSLFRRNEDLRVEAYAALDIFSLVVISKVLMCCSRCSLTNFNFSSFDQYLFFPPFGLPIKSSP